MLVNSKEKLFLFSLGSLRAIILEFWVSSVSQIMSSFSTNKRQLLMCLYLSTTKWQLMRLHPVMNKWLLNSVCSLKIHHMLAFFGCFLLSTKHSRRFASPLTHTGLIESEVLPCLYHLVITERVEERQPLTPPPFCNSCLLLSSTDGQRLALPSPVTQRMY